MSPGLIELKKIDKVKEIQINLPYPKKYLLPL